MLLENGEKRGKKEKEKGFLVIHFFDVSAKKIRNPIIIIIIMTITVPCSNEHTQTVDADMFIYI